MQLKYLAALSIISIASSAAALERLPGGDVRGVQFMPLHPVPKPLLPLKSNDIFQPVSSSVIAPMPEPVAANEPMTREQAQQLLSLFDDSM